MEYFLLQSLISYGVATYLHIAVGVISGITLIMVFYGFVMTLVSLIEGEFLSKSLKVLFFGLLVGWVNHHAYTYYENKFFDCIAITKETSKCVYRETVGDNWSDTAIIYETKYPYLKYNRQLYK